MLEVRHEHVKSYLTSAPPYLSSITTCHLASCSPNMATEGRVAELPTELRYIQYDSSLESQYFPSIRALISKDLSEPYSIYVYRYFLYQWGDLCFMVSPSLSYILDVSKSTIGSASRNLSSHRCHNQQARAPPITLTPNSSRLYCHARSLLLLPESRHSHNSRAPSNRCYD